MVNNRQNVMRIKLTREWLNKLNEIITHCKFGNAYYVDEEENFIYCKNYLDENSISSELKSKTLHEVVKIIKLGKLSLLENFEYIKNDFTEIDTLAVNPAMERRKQARGKEPLKVVR